MCFSASASFGSGVVLVIMGVASISKVEGRSELPLAFFPFIFAIQQVSEGFVWLSLTNPTYSGWQDIPMYSFLIFSHVLWPTWIPFSILLLEKDLQRKKILWFLFGTGITMGLYHIYCLIYLPVNARIDGHHIQYLIAHPVSLLMPANILYALATIFPPFISSIRRMWWLGLFILISYIAAYLVYRAYVISVWCYFATLLSIIVYLILTRFQKQSSGQKLKFAPRLFR